MNQPPPRPDLREVFGPLRAEAETAWLEQVFVRPFSDSEYAVINNTVIVGEQGSGKTAVLCQLAARLRAAAGPTYIPVFWQPWLPPEDAAPYALAARLVEQLFSACAETLLSWIGQHPQQFQAAPGWAQDGLVSFIVLSLQNPLGLTLYQLEASSTPEGQQLLRQRFDQPPARASFPKDLPHPRQIHNLVSMVSALPEVKGLWVLVDGLEALLALDAERLQEVLKAFFSTLALFEDAGFVIKVALPKDLEQVVSLSSGQQRRRINLVPLEWPLERLRALAEARAGFVLGQERAPLAELAEAAPLEDALQRFGGRSPRGWLEVLRPVLAAYLENSPRRPLAAAELAAIRRANPPLLRVDLTRREVFLGYGRVDTLQPKPMRVLEYLYKHRGQPCSHEDLYYLALEELPAIPRSKSETSYKFPKQYTGLVDTALWRLRKSIEPDPKQPVYIITVHSHGTRLENCW